MTAPTHNAPANRKWSDQARAALEELLRASLARGFYGVVQLEVGVQDGTIQHLRRRIERLDK